MKTKPSPIKKNLLHGLLAFCALWLALRAQAATVAHEWKFENNFNDTSGNGNNGTISGTPAPIYVTGVFGGQGIYLNRANLIQSTSPVGLPPSPIGLPTTGAASWSEDVWLYLTNAPDSLAMLCGFGATVNAAGQSRSLISFGTAPYTKGIYSWGNSRDLSAQKDYPLKEWIMVTITHDGTTGTRTIWLDGTNLVSGVQTLNNIQTLNQFVTVGARSP